MLILLVFIVICTAFAGGVWLKLKTAQLGSDDGSEKCRSSRSSTIEGSAGADVPNAANTANAIPATATASTDDAFDTGEPDLSRPLRRS